MTKSLWFHSIFCDKVQGPSYDPKHRAKETTTAVLFKVSYQSAKKKISEIKCKHLGTFTAIQEKFYMY